MAKPTTSGFTISGLLDRSASTRNDYPVERIPIEEIADHPANAAYSMDEAGIAQLAKSIEEEGLTDLPLVRKLDDGGWQMVSGHRRKAAYALLAKEDEKYAQIPCRVIRGITDEQSVMLLHAANYFVRSLTVTERAAASRALGVEVERMRAENPELSGVRTEDIKAAIISEQTGRKVSGKTIQRQESLARKIEERLCRYSLRLRSSASLICAGMTRTMSLAGFPRSSSTGWPSSSSTLFLSHTSRSVRSGMSR